MTVHTQRYTDPVAIERLRAGRCPECGGQEDDHTGWGGSGCSLTDNGVAQRVYAQYVADHPAHPTEKGSIA